MSEKTAEKYRKIHAESLYEFKAVQEVQRDERMQCVEDRRFVTIAGAQWEGELQRQFENRPKLEVNKIQLSLDRIKNEYKNNRITANFEPANGDEGDTLADTCDDLYRATERKSSAKEAYDNAFDEGVSGGMGAWRLATEYEDEFDPDNDNQNIMIYPIYDADSTVFFDLGAKRQDKLDATKGWLLNPMTKDQYIEQYNDDPESWPHETGSTFFYDFSEPDLVYVAEYYVVEENIVLRTTLVSLTGDEETIDDIDDDTTQHFLDIGYTVKSQRKVKDRQVHKYIMSGGGILSDEGIIAGKYIPIPVFYGKRSYINNIERISGHTRPAKDMQRLKNMQVSSLAEVASRTGDRKPIFTPDQIAGHEKAWNTENIINPAYLLINPIIDKDGNEVPSGPISYTESAQMSSATAALLSLTDQDIKEILGDSAQGEQIVSNISGDAIEKIQNRIDMQTYGFMDNFARAVETSGIIWLSMAKDIYTSEGSEGRKLKGRTRQGASRQIELMRRAVDPKTKEVFWENDFSRANMEINVEVGPSSSTKRKATADALTSLLKYALSPEDQSIITSMILMNMEGEGVSDAREYYRKKLVLSGVIQPTEEEAAEMAKAQKQEPTADEIYLKSEAQKNESIIMKNMADVGKTIAETGKTEAETAETIEGIERDARTELFTEVDKLNQT